MHSLNDSFVWELVAVIVTRRMDCNLLTFPLSCITFHYINISSDSNQCDLLMRRNHDTVNDGQSKQWQMGSHQWSEVIWEIVRNTTEYAITSNTNYKLQH